MKIHLLIVIVVVLLGALPEAKASSDDCAGSPELFTVRRDLSYCYTDLPFLEPNNDSLAALRQLVKVFPGSSEKQPEKKNPETEPQVSLDLAKLIKEILPEEAESLAKKEANDETTYVRYDFFEVRQTNTPDRAAAFLVAAQAALPKSELASLAKVRLSLLNSTTEFCKGPVPSLPASDFAAYLAAMSELYCLRYDVAAAGFCALSESTNSWIGEAATYSCARATLLSSQTNWDGYSDPADGDVNAELARKGDTLLQRYLEEYPQGQYAQSAAGLRRRAAYLAGDWQLLVARLTEEFERNRANGETEELDSILIEFDRYAFIAYSRGGILSTNPLLAAATLFQWLREPSESQIVAIESWLNSNATQLSEYPGITELFNGHFDLQRGRFEKLVSVKTDVSAIELRFALEDLQARGLAAQQRWDEAIAIRKQQAKVISELTPAPKYNPETSEHLPIEQFRELSMDFEIPQEGSGAYSYMAERMKVWELQTVLQAGRLEQVLASSDFPAWAVQKVIQAGLSEGELSKLCKNPAAPSYQVDSSCRTLLRLYVYAKKYSDANTVASRLSPRVRSEFGELLAVLPDLSSAEPSAASFVVLGDFLTKDAEQIGEFQITDEDYFLPLKNASWIRSEKIDSNEIPFRIFENALQQAAQAKQHEAEAAATAKLINCFHSGTWAWNCAGTLARATLEEEYPKERRRQLFLRLKQGPLKNTKAAKSQSYWY